MPGPLSNPDGKKDSPVKRAKRTAGELVVTGKTAVKRNQRVRVEDE